MEVVKGIFFLQVKLAKKINLTLGRDGEAVGNESSQAGSKKSSKEVKTELKKYNFLG